MSFPSESIPNFELYPKSFLDAEEQAFLLWLHPGGLPRPLISSFEVASQVKSLWDYLFPTINLPSLSRHLYSGRSYANREYILRSGHRIGLWLFRKGLLRKYPMPAKRAKLQFLYGYPREVYRLVPKNFCASFPPHATFARWVFSELWADVQHASLAKASPPLLSVPHWDGSGVFVCDNCFSVPLLGRDYYLWVEVHTGSEGYDERYFLKRLLTMEHYLSERKHGQFIIIVPFARNLLTASTAITQYNTKIEREGLALPILDLRFSRILHFGQIKELKESLGLYEHRHWKG